MAVPLLPSPPGCPPDQGVLSHPLPTLTSFFPRGQAAEMPSNTRLAEQPPCATSRCHPRSPRFPVALPSFRSLGSPQRLPPRLTFHPERPRGSTIIFAHLKVAGSIPLPFRNVLTMRSRRSVGSARAVALRSYERPWATLPSGALPLRSTKPLREQPPAPGGGSGGAAEGAEGLVPPPCSTSRPGKRFFTAADGSAVIGGLKVTS